MADGTQIYGLTTIDTTLTAGISSAGTIVFNSSNSGGTIQFIGAVQGDETNYGDKAPLIVQNTKPYANPWTQFAQVWLDATGAPMCYVRNDGTFMMGGSQGQMRTKRVCWQAGEVAIELSGTRMHLNSKNRVFVFVHSTYFEANYDHADQTNPTVYIQSATNPDTRNQEFGSLAHNTSDFLVGTGTGNVVITARATSSNPVSLSNSSMALYIDEVTGELKGTVRYSNGTTGLCTLCSITT
jgi:hypothetical protein